MDYSSALNRKHQEDLMRQIQSREGWQDSSNLVDDSNSEAARIREGRPIQRFTDSPGEVAGLQRGVLTRRIDQEPGYIQRRSAPSAPNWTDSLKIDQADPYGFDPYKVADDSIMREMPAIVEHIFGKDFDYRQMDQNQRAYLSKSLETIRGQRIKQASEMRDMAIKRAEAEGSRAKSALAATKLLYQPETVETEPGAESLARGTGAMTAVGGMPEAQDRQYTVPESMVAWNASMGQPQKGLVDQSIAVARMKQDGKGKKPLNIDVKKIYNVPVSKETGLPDPAHEMAATELNRVNLRLEGPEDENVFIASGPAVFQAIEDLKASGRPITPAVVENVIKDAIGQVRERMLGQPSSGSALSRGTGSPTGKKPFPDLALSRTPDQGGKVPFPERGPAVNQPPPVETIYPGEIPNQEPVSSARTPHEAVYGKRPLTKDETWLDDAIGAAMGKVKNLPSSTQVGTAKRFGEGPLEHAMRLAGDGSEVNMRQRKAEALKRKYPGATDEQLARAILNGAKDLKRLSAMGGRE